MKGPKIQGAYFILVYVTPVRERRLHLWTVSQSSLQTRPWGGLL